MNNADIQVMINNLTFLSYQREEALIESEGEVTEQISQLEEVIADTTSTLLNDGIDSLGRWLKAKSDELNTYKAEREAAARRVKSCEETIDYIKANIGQILAVTEKDSAKGTFYTFKPATKTTTSVDKEALNGRYAEKALEALSNAGLPPYVTITLGAKVSLVPEGEELPDIFIQSKATSCKFIKPRGSKVEEE